MRGIEIKSLAVAASVGVAAAVGAIVLNIQTWSDNNADLNLADESGFLSPVTDPVAEEAQVQSHDSASRVFQSGPDVDELLNGLLLAADAGDTAAIREIQLMLAGHDQSEVVSKASARVDQERRASLGLKERQVGLRRAVLFDLIVADDPGALLSELRRLWRDPDIRGHRGEKWLHTEKRILEIPAFVALDELSRPEASAISDVLGRALLAGNNSKLNPLLRLLTDLSAVGPSRSEIHDPWLSQIAANVASARERLSVSGWQLLRPWLAAIYHQDEYSQRLRLQVGVYLIDAPKSYWDLLTLVQSADSSRAAARALADYLVRQSLSVDEVHMLVDLVRQRFGGNLDDFRKLMTAAVRLGGTRVPVEHWGKLAEAFVDIGVRSSSDSSDRYATILLLNGLREEWYHSRHVGQDRGPLFRSASPYDTLDSIKTLYRNVVLSRQSGGAKGIHQSILDGFSGMTLNLVWFVELPIEVRLRAVTEMLMSRELLTSAECLAVENGLAAVRSELLFSHGGSVAKLLAFCCTRNEVGYMSVSESERPISLNAFVVISVRQWGETLQQVGWPSLERGAEDIVRKLAEAVFLDSKEWTSEHAKAYHISPGTVDRIRTLSQKLEERYSGR